MENKIRIAIFHNFMDNIGGAEMVCLTLARELKASLYTTNIDYEKIRKMGFEDVIPRIISIGKVPINAPFRHQIALFRFRRLSLKNRYDFFIIGGDWALSGVMNNKPNLWYVHSPPRELFDLKEYVKKTMVVFWKKPLFDLWVKLNRHLFRKYINHADILVCNSNNTKNRLKKYLNREAVVINPPINTEKLKFNKTGDYWLSVNRLYYHKRIDLQIKAFQKLKNEKLIIVGSYEQSAHFKKYAEYIKRIKPENVEIISWLNQEKLVELYSNCRGFITTSKDEDFGMNVVEAMASGKPVIAPAEGGYKETIINNKTGILIEDINEDKIIDAINIISRELKRNPLKYKKACINQAKRFDTKVFVDKIKECIDNFYNN